LLPLTIGLTGGIGSGKSTVADLFASYGIEIIDADKIARDITHTEQPVLNEIVAKFGPAILDAHHRLNRHALRDIIFADASKREWLEHLLHPLIRAKMKQKTAQACSPYCLHVIPLLTERDNDRLQRILVVDAPESAQIKRVLERDNISPTQAQAILNAQITREQRLSLADDVIMNDRNREYLKQQVQSLHTLYLTLANAAPSNSALE
jgi:dephospho-CoA kinase